LLGALVLYGLGAWLGRDRMRAIARRLPLVDVDDVDKTEAWFGRHGSKAVFFGRMIPIFRSLISIPAGIERMPLWKFALLTTTGSLIWNTAFILAGFFLGEQWHVVEAYAGILQWIVIALVVGAIGWFVVSRLRRRSAPTE
jgi:membrane protein DedA with SNARE-associated domain